jgi:hypothetical protein
MAVQYTEQALTIPADVCKILERESLLDSGCDDFGLNFEIVNGKLAVTDMMQYITKSYEPMEPEDAWILVRKWWEQVEEAQKYQIAINKKQKEIAKLQAEVAILEKTEEKKKWRLW